MQKQILTEIIYRIIKHHAKAQTIQSISVAPTPEKLKGGGRTEASVIFLKSRNKMSHIISLNSIKL